MFERQEFRGYWWIPEHPEQRVPGTLEFSQAEITLDLLGRFKEQSSSFFPLPRPRILGDAEGNKSLTLEDCGPGGANLAGLVSTKYVPTTVLVGAHYGPHEPVTFDTMAIHFDELDVWAAISGFSRKITTDENEAGETVLKAIDVHFEPPPAVEVTIAPGVRLSLEFGWRYDDRTPLKPEVEIRQRAGLVLRFDDGVSVQDARSYVRQFRNFLGLAVARPVQPTEVKGIVLAPQDSQPDAFTKLKPQPIVMEVLYRLPDVDERQGTRPIYPHEMLFGLHHVQDRLEAILQSWFAKQELLRPVFDLYFGAIYNRRAYLEQTFLSLIQAIETYHRRVHSSATEDPPDLHRKRLKAIVDAAPEPHRAWLNEKLAFSNELTLSERIDAVLSRCPQLVERIVGDKKAFNTRVRKARNYLTHLDPKSERAAPKGMELYPLTIQLRTLLELQLLSELGFACGEVDAAFERAQRFEELANAAE